MSETPMAHELDTDDENEPFTVVQMIAELQKLPPDMRVMVHGAEGGYDDASAPVVKEIRLNVHTELYYGPHDTPYDGDEGGEVVKAAII